jgi:hypothetical protein
MIETRQSAGVLSYRLFRGEGRVAGLSTLRLLPLTTGMGLGGLVNVKKVP